MAEGQHALELRVWLGSALRKHEQHRDRFWFVSFRNGVALRWHGRQLGRDTVLRLAPSLYGNHSFARVYAPACPAAASLAPRACQKPPCLLRVRWGSLGAFPNGRRITARGRHPGAAVSAVLQRCPASGGAVRRAPGQVPGLLPYRVSCRAAACTGRSLRHSVVTSERRNRTPYEAGPPKVRPTCLETDRMRLGHRNSPGKVLSGAAHHPVPGVALASQPLSAALQRI